MRRQWTINGRFLAQPLTGVQRYALETVRALDGLIAGQADFARGLEVELVLPPDAVHSPALRAIGMRTVGRGGGHAWEQTALPRAVAGGLLSLCNTGPLSVRKQIVCIHDTNAHRLSGERWRRGCRQSACARCSGPVLPLWGARLPRRPGAPSCSQAWPPPRPTVRMPIALSAGLWMAFGGRRGPVLQPAGRRPPGRRSGRASLGLVSSA